MAAVNDAPVELVAEAASGPHRGWDTFDIKLEGVRFQSLHNLVSAPSFDARIAGQLVGELSDMAESYGYGTADSYLTDASGMSDDEIDADLELAIMRDRIFDDYEEDQYFIDVRTSERALLAAAATPEAREFLGAQAHREGWDGAWGAIHRHMTEAYRQGRDRRKEQEGPSAPRP